jgi:hypothetical protein
VAVKERPISERPAELRTWHLSGVVRVFLDDLEEVVHWFREVDNSTGIHTPRYDLDEVADLRDVPESEAKVAEVAAPARGIWFALHGRQAPTIKWLERGDDDVRRTVNAVAGYFSSVVSTRWPNRIFIACIAYALSGAVAAAGVIGSHRALGWTIAATAILAFIACVLMSLRLATKLIRTYRPSGPSLWDRKPGCSRGELACHCGDTVAERSSHHHRNGRCHAARDGQLSGTLVVRLIPLILRRHATLPRRISR